MNKPHVHAALIKAWADGAEIESNDHGKWISIDRPAWFDNYEYRIKPQQKPDSGVVASAVLKSDGALDVAVAGYYTPNMRFIFDGETNELKAVELLK